MNKKAYQKPSMKVVKIQHKCHILEGSGFGAKSLSSNSEGISWENEGFEDSDADY